MGSWYNGYSGHERDKKFKEYKLLVKRGILSPPTGPCALCGDPDVPVECHDEAYGEPFIWEPPALLALCRHCHRSKLHKRFGDVAGWQAFIAHIRRGGYARDLKNKDVKDEVRRCKEAILAGEHFILRNLRHYAGTVGQEWFSRLRLDPESLADPAARPRS